MNEREKKELNREKIEKRAWLTERKKIELDWPKERK